jgi:uncharacterized protein YjiS (DUF1127 family)
MTMSAISTTAERQDNAGSGILKILAAAVKRWWAAYIDWRIEHGAILALRAMSDRELSDMGINRSEITGAVRGVLGTRNVQRV